MRFRDFLGEEKEKHAVLAFGRMNPITSGHEKLIHTVKGVAKQVGGSHHIVLSHSQDEKKNPLSGRQKLTHARRAFPGTNFSVSDKEHPNFLKQAEKLHKSGVTHLHMVGGSDRVKEFHDTLHRYNGTGEGKLFNFKKITVHSAGERDPDAEGTTGISASKMREHAKSGKFEHFKKGAPSSMSHAHVKQMYHDVRRGMGMHEDVNEDFELLLSEGVHDKSIFKAVFLAGGPGSGKDYVLDNTLAGHGLVEINSDKALEFLMDKRGLDKQMPETEKQARDVVRGRAKNMTEVKQRLALVGRNGLIINGTGDDPAKIDRIKTALEGLGYDTSMIMVNTNDDVSAARNIERGQRGGRTVPETVRKQKWDAVQDARTEYAKMFGDNYMEYDNSEDLRQAPPEVVKQKKDELLQLYTNVKNFVSEPPQSPQAQEWVANELDKKDTLPVDTKGPEKMPHYDSQAAQEAKKLGLQYYGFGRYGKNGTVTHRSVHDNLVPVTHDEPQEKNVPVSGSSMRKEDIDLEFETLEEDLRKWFDKDHPEGGWKRINSKGEAIGPCAREPGEPKPKCMSNEKRAKLSKQERASAVRAKRKHDPNPERKGAPINVSNFGKGKLSESYGLTDSSALNLLLLGNDIDEKTLYFNGENDKYDIDEETKFLTDKSGRPRIFMLRRAAAKEAHTKNGTVLKYKNGYIVKLNEENQNVDISKRTVRNWIEEAREQRQPSSTESYTAGLITETCTGTSASESCSDEATRIAEETSGSSESHKITLSEIRQRKKEACQVESIDKGIEPGLSMAGAGESLGRDMGEKIRKKDGKVVVTNETIGAGGEMATSMSDYNENDLKRKGINLQSFKAKRPIA